ncbi:MAG: histidine kinase [Candidatus Polarisedimenticolaceae bacterium]|nr:histidine kinase [Candidatus Polarisedimenticolaceae bacterium]
MNKTSEQQPINTFLPHFCGVKPLFIVVLVAELLAMILTLSSSVDASQLWQFLSLTSLYIQWIAITSCGLLCLIRPQLIRLPNGWAGFLVWLILLFVTAVISEMTHYALGEINDYHWLDADGHLSLLLRSLGISAIVSLLLLRYLHLQHLNKQQEVAESQFRLQALQSRIRPHFLFNSMNTIASLTRSQPELAETITEDLADLFRVSLSDASQLTTLSEEIDLAKRYLNIEAQRLGDRLQIEWHLEDDLPLDALLPSLTLQPLLENAIYHGIEPSTRPGKIHISARYRRSIINISIRNTLPEQQRSSVRQGHQLAMDNIQQRLDIAFANHATLNRSHVDGEYQVRLAFPHPRIKP